MRKAIHYLIAILAIVCMAACRKDAAADPIPTPVPPKAKTVSLENFTTIPAGFVCSSPALRTDPATGNVWMLVYKSFEGGEGNTPVMQCFDSQYAPITGGWTYLTQKTCPLFGSDVDFAILKDGSAVCAYAQSESAGFELIYYSVIKPDGTIVNGDGTLVYDVRNDFPELKECSAQAKVMTDGKGGAWIALSYRKMIVVRHLSSSLKMSEPVKIFTKESVPVKSAMNINLMLAADGGLFLTEYDMTEDEVHTTATWRGNANLIKVDAACTSYTSTEIISDDVCNPGSRVEIIPDTKGGAYLVTVEPDQDTHTELIICGHMDKNGKVGELKTVATSDFFKTCAFGVVPSDNTLCIALAEQYNLSGVVLGHGITLIDVNEASEVLYEMPFREFDADANLQSVAVIAREGSVMDVCYIYHDKEAEPINLNVGIGTADFSKKTVAPSVDRKPLTDGPADLVFMTGSGKYMNGKANIGWADILLHGDVYIGQVVLK